MVLCLAIPLSALHFHDDFQKYLLLQSLGYETTFHLLPDKNNYSIALVLAQFTYG
jgi:WD40 repeat protein